MLRDIRSICLICVAIALVRAQTTTPVTDASTLVPTTVPPTVDPTTDVTDGSTATPVGAVTDASTLAPTTDVTAGSTATPIGAVTDASTLVPTTDVTDGSTVIPTGGAVTDTQTTAQVTVNPPSPSPTTAMTDIQTTAQPTNGTILPTLSTEGITLECNANNMTVTIPKAKVSAGSMGGEDLQFELSNSSFCKGNESTENPALYIVLTTSLVGCGTDRSEEGDMEVYTNRVINSYSNDTISRHYVVDIPLTCTYNRTKRVSQKYKLTDYTVDKELQDGGAYDFDFSIYEDDDFTIPYEHYPVRIGLDEEFYFAASVLSLDNSLELSLESCKATPSDNYEDNTFYPIIENYGETAQQDINITCKYGDRNLVGVTMNTFRFIGKSDMVYLHCDLRVCSADEDDSECDKQCPIIDPTNQTGNARRRRDVSRDHISSQARKRLTRGPIRVIRSASRNEWSPQISNDDAVHEEYANVFSPWMIAMTLMATIVMALFALMVVVLHKLNKMSASNKCRRECLEEETLALMDYEE